MLGAGGVMPLAHAHVKYDLVSMVDAFRRWLLPGFVFQSVVIAGGYGTGRELVELAALWSGRGLERP